MSELAGGGSRLVACGMQHLAVRTALFTAAALFAASYPLLLIRCFLSAAPYLLPPYSLSRMASFWCALLVCPPGALSSHTLSCATQAFGHT